MSATHPLPLLPLYFFIRFCLLKNIETFGDHCEEGSHRWLALSGGCGSKEKKLYGKQDHKFSGTFLLFYQMRHTWRKSCILFLFFIVRKKKIIHILLPKDA